MCVCVWLPWWLSSKESACNAGDIGSVPKSGRPPREGITNALQYSCLENPVDRGAWCSTLHGIARAGHDLVTKPPPPCIFCLGQPYTNAQPTGFWRVHICIPKDHTKTDTQAHLQNKK